jgi:hypothetical protein
MTILPVCSRLSIYPFAEMTTAEASQGTDNEEETD